MLKNLHILALITAQFVKYCQIFLYFAIFMIEKAAGGMFFSETRFSSLSRKLYIALFVFLYCFGIYIDKTVKHIVPIA